MENSVPALQPTWRTRCLLCRYFNLTVTFSKWCYSGSPRRREGTEQKVYPLLHFLLSSVAPAPLSVFSTFLTWPLRVCRTYFLQSRDGFSAFLKMFCSLCWWINRRTELIPWSLGGGGRRETKEGNTKFELQAYINYVFRKYTGYKLMH